MNIYTFTTASECKLIAKMGKIFHKKIREKKKVI
jgi:hypothetical protein